MKVGKGRRYFFLDFLEFEDFFREERLAKRGSFVFIERFVGTWLGVVIYRIWELIIERKEKAEERKVFKFFIGKLEGGVSWGLESLWDVG